MHACVCVCACVRACVRVWARAPVHVLVYEHMYVMYVCMYVCVNANMSMYASNIRMYVLTRTYVCVRICMYMHTCIHAYIYKFNLTNTIRLIYSYQSFTTCGENFRETTVSPCKCHSLDFCNGFRIVSAHPGGGARPVVVLLAFALFDIHAYVTTVT